MISQEPSFAVLGGDIAHVAVTQVTKLMPETMIPLNDERIIRTVLSIVWKTLFIGRAYYFYFYLTKTRMAVAVAELNFLSGRR